MSDEVTCPGCGKRWRIDRHPGDGPVRCEACGAMLPAAPVDPRGPEQQGPDSGRLSVGLMVTAIAAVIGVVLLSWWTFRLAESPTPPPDSPPAIDQPTDEAPPTQPAPDAAPDAAAPDAAPQAIPDAPPASQP